MLGLRASRGDTLVEVLFATAVFSLVVVGSMLVMNQGTATAQRSLEITLVRQEMDSQAETLRFLNSSYIAAYKPGLSDSDYSGYAREWKKLETITNPTAFDSTACVIPTGINAFILNTHKATFQSLNSVPAQTFARVNYDGSDNVTSAEGIWIEAVRPVITNRNGQANASYIDFHIRACWDSPGQSTPVTLGTIVRLYEPR